MSGAGTIATGVGGPLVAARLGGGNDLHNGDAAVVPGKTWCWASR